VSIRRYCRIFLRSFDAHFFIFAGGERFKFNSYIDSFEPKFPAVFFCRNKQLRCCGRCCGSHRSAMPTERQVADLLGHSTTQVTEMYYVKKDVKMLNGVTDGFCL